MTASLLKAFESARPTYSVRYSICDVVNWRCRTIGSRRQCACMMVSPEAAWDSIRQRGRIFACLLVLAFCQIGTAAERPRPILFTPGLGLRISLETTGYLFPTPSTASGTDQFSASVALLNRTRAPISFHFSSPNAARDHFLFEIFDYTGAQVWHSPEVITPTEVQLVAVLGRGEIWKRTVRIPLVIAGTPLAPGRYTLEATLNGDTSIGARAAFVVLASEPANPGLTGIDGTVWLTGFSDDG